MLTITSVKVYPYKNKSPNCAIGVGQIVFDNCLLLSGLELVERTNRRYIRYPKNRYNNHHLCYCQPINAEIAKVIETALFNAYDNATSALANTLSDTYLQNAVKDMVDILNAQSAEAKINETAGQALNYMYEHKNGIPACKNDLGDIGPESNNNSDISDPAFDNKLNIIEENN